MQCIFYDEFLLTKHISSYTIIVDNGAILAVEQFQRYVYFLYR